MQRSLTARNLFEKRIGKTVRFDSELLAKAIGEAEMKGGWLIYGPEKNGKTWFTLQLAKALAYYEKVAYISAEEGTDLSFRRACERAGINDNDKILFDEYLSVDEMIEKFSKPKTANILIVDNLTIYRDEFKSVGIRDFINALPNKLIIMVAHEDRKEPYPACAKMASKMAKVIIQVKGLRAHVVSRFSEGGAIEINDDMSEMYWGDQKLTTLKQTDYENNHRPSTCLPD
jgi:archaellum biogenesis ATPase FlaH